MSAEAIEREQRRRCPMSLVVSICINNQPPVALVIARRTAGGEAPGDVNSYEVRHFDTRNNNLRQAVDVVEVLHRYGDGAAVLARKALEATT